MEYRADEKRYERMKYRRCKNSGLLLPEVSLGMWHNFGSTCSFENMRAMCRTAFDLGIVHFDLANNYGPVPGSAEENWGRILKKDFSVYRDELVISTKAGYEMWDGPYGNWGSRKHLLASLDQSLKRMQMEYVDIFYHHRMDGDTPLEESMEALVQAVRSGKALYAGISNYDGEQTQKAVDYMKSRRCPLVINQSRYSIFDRTIEKNGLKTYAKEEHLGVICYSPLAQGLLTDRYLHGIPQDSRIAVDSRFLKRENLTKERMEQIRELNEIAQERGQSLAQMALAWVLKDAEITSVLIGASKPKQIEDNAQAAAQTAFTEEELERIEKICGADQKNIQIH